MINLRGLGTLSLVFVLGATSFVACGDDDDDDNGNVAGRAGASHAGAFNGGAATGEGGDLGNPSRGGASSRGGTSPRGGAAGNGATAASGGTLGMAGAVGVEQSGVGGESAGTPADLGGAGAGGSATAALSDAQILLVLDTLNQGEVEEAYAALPRLTATDVRAFAQRMVNDHGDARQAVLATADALNLAPLPSDTQAELKSEGEAHVDMLRATPAAALDATYVNLEVAGHAEALELLDDLAPAADAPELETLITTLRGTVQQHYQAAQELQAEL